MMTVDYLAIGVGFAASSVARILADHLREVIIPQTACRLGGNIYDSVHGFGVRLDMYGPYYFRCTAPSFRP